MFKRGLKCSFCRRGEAEVSKLVAGPRVYICDVCAAEVSRIMNDSPAGPARPAAVAHDVPRVLGAVWTRIKSWVRATSGSRIDYLVSG